MSSLRQFLLITVLATLVLVNFLAAIHGYQRSMVAASAMLDDKLKGFAHQLLSLPLSGPAMPAASDHGLAFQLTEGNVSQGPGRMFWRSSHTPVQALNTPEGFSEVNFGGFRWRAYSQQADTPPRRVVVAERVDLRYGLTEKVIIESILPMLLSLPLAGVLIWLIVSYGLRSLKELARKLRVKSSDDLQAISLSEVPAELAPVLESVNSLMARLQEAFERERRFSADAAHELRPPITAIRMHVHNAITAPESAAESLGQLQVDVQRLSHLIEQMLDLHRTEPDSYGGHFEAVDLGALVREMIARHYDQFAHKQQHIGLNGQAPAVRGDRFALEILLRNLLSNANKYTPVGGEIQVNLAADNAGVRLSVADNGPGISPADRERIFERFYRVGGDRHSSGESGCGLGLSIVSHIAVLHRADLQLGVGIGGLGLSVSLVFPAAGALARVSE